jgi:hypothetical protein
MNMLLLPRRLTGLSLAFAIVASGCAFPTPARQPVQTPTAIVDATSAVTATVTATVTTTVALTTPPR